MNRDDMVKRIERADEGWDLIIIGGGATGLGTAIDAASRGYRTLLIEQSDWAKGTSSRSTKLVHGGVRYLQQGNVSLVLEALKERGLMRRNAPHLVHNLPFVVPNYDWWEGPFYGIGLKVYDMLAGKHGFGRSKTLDKGKTLTYIPTVEPAGLRGGVVYYDGQFDDARLAINMAQTAVEQGATVVNYMKVKSLIKSNDMVKGVVTEDMETGEAYELRTRAVINATGVFSDSIRRMDDADAQPIIASSQGVHIVLDKSFLPGKTAIMVPHTDDGRVLFAIPWHDRVVVGTTDTPVARVSLEPRPLPEELDFLLEHAARYLTQDPTPADIRSVFAGLRPLVRQGGEEHTAAISRDHTIHISRSGLLTITGGKWTTYRKMAEDTVDQAAYGADALGIREVFEEKPEYAVRLHPELPIRAGEVVWSVRHEMARTVEDFLARRTRALLLDARASMEMAPQVAGIMTEVLGRDDAWKRRLVEEYVSLAQGYLMVCDDGDGSGCRQIFK